MGADRSHDLLLAIGMWLLLFLYARWLNWNDARRENEKRRRERQDEREHSTPLPPELRWPPEMSRFATRSRR